MTKPYTTTEKKTFTFSILRAKTANGPTTTNCKHSTGLETMSIQATEWTHAGVLLWANKQGDFFLFGRYWRSTCGHQGHTSSRKIKQFHFCPELQSPYFRVLPDDPREDLFGKPTNVCASHGEKFQRNSNFLPCWKETTKMFQVYSQNLLILCQCLASKTQRKAWLPVPYKHWKRHFCF